MKTKGLNPYLPFWETVPDGEPHVFDGRIYIYGSHDLLRGTRFCEDDYVCWSAPVEDPGDWRYEGVIYKKGQDPINGAPYDKEVPPFDPGLEPDREHCLYAPDVAVGPDGRYYLFYALDMVNVISVAVCDTPAGQYEFLDFVTYENGEIPFEGRKFDPAIYSDETGNYLYYGFCPAFRFPGMEGAVLDGAYMVKLADDMHTVITKPVCVANGPDTAEGTPYAEHPVFEASSLRKIGEWYYFVYSSLQGNELCYGMAKIPEGPFEYKGVIVSNGDIGYKGNELPTNYMGNNHGGLVVIDEKPFIFWHRQTHGTAFSRQGCADPVTILEDGTIPQIEITSCGLNNGPLLAAGTYQTYIACQITEKDRSKMENVVMSMPGQPLPEFPVEMPYVTEEECIGTEKNLKPYIHNMREGAVAGFKYFAFAGNEAAMELEVRGNGTLEAFLDKPEGTPVASVTSASDAWVKLESNLENVSEGTHALYFKVKEGILDFAEFTFK